MDKTLAEFYGTNVEAEGDAEKLAAAEAAEVLAGEKGVNLEEMSAEELEAVAQEVLKGEGEEDPEKPEVKEPEGEEAQTKFAEADYMGRVMAHAFVQETKEIEKEAAAKAEVAAKAKTAGKGGKVMDHLKKVKKSAAMPPQFMKHMKGEGKEEKKEEKEKEDKKEKKSSAFDQLVDARIAEILKANEIDPASVSSELEKKSAAEAEPTEVVDQKALLAQKVDEKAYEALKELGFQIEEKTE